MGKITDIKKGQRGATQEPDKVITVQPPPPELAEELRQLSCVAVLSLAVAKGAEIQSSLIDVFYSARKRCVNCKGAEDTPCSDCLIDAGALMDAMTKAISLAECLRVATGSGSRVGLHMSEELFAASEDDQDIDDLLALHNPKYSQ